MRKQIGLLLLLLAVLATGAEDEGTAETKSPASAEQPSEPSSQTPSE